MAKARKAAQLLTSGMPWRDIDETRGLLGGLDEIPPEVEAFGKFMKEQAAKGSTKRDLLKAYTITRSSVNRGGLRKAKAESKGLLTTSDEEKIRPEGAFADWLMSDAGQAYLNAAEKGQLDERAIADIVAKFQPFGMADTLGEDLRYAAQALPLDPAKVTDVIRAADAGETQIDAWRGMIDPVRGVKSAKTGFLGSLIGYGELPTLDARQLSLQTTDRKAADKIAKSAPKSRLAVDELKARQDALGIAVPEYLKPQASHLQHHAIWDRASGTRTSHEDLINAMRLAGVGGVAATGLLAGGDEAEAADLEADATPEERAVLDRLDELPPAMLDRVLGDPELFKMFSAMDRKVSIDDAGNATAGELAPRHSIREILDYERQRSGAQMEALEDPSLLRAGMRKGLDTVGANPVLRENITSAMDWTPGWGTMTGMEDVGAGMNMAADAAVEGDYGRAGLLGGLSAAFGGAELLGLPVPSMAKAVRRTKRTAR